ncbi:MAG: hypothetical protein MZV65_32140 [Chromatiales bacterium]|nr:hypothetical protein [Chromatiales bacterium]
MAACWSSASTRWSFHHLDALLLITAGALAMAVATIQMRKLRGVGVFALQAWIALCATPALALLPLLFEQGQGAAMRTASWLELAAPVYSAIGASPDRARHRLPSARPLSGQRHHAADAADACPGGGVRRAAVGRCPDLEADARRRVDPGQHRRHHPARAGAAAPLDSG